MNELADLTALWLTIKLALLTTVLLLIFGLPAAWALSRYKGRLKPIFEAVIALPLVLPPTVLGFYFLLAFAPQSFLGQLWFDLTGSYLAFSFTGILFGSVIYSLPFVLQPLLTGFSQINHDLIDTAKSLGVNGVKRFLFLVLPLIRPAILSAMTLGFAHTLGEFGLVLMIGGNIPGETQVLSIALYDHVETLNYAAANQLAFILVAFSFTSLVLLYKFNRGFGPFKGAGQ
ncbi:molybdate ABC transporter permease subunit [Psychrosphaera sp. B3R10]|uniref:Molybdenum transport system permease n=1 Tax=Psychrosphaera algicola TaxID=3023714 RepID=A0ABT5FAD9_9GAMM|nr:MULTISPECIES: molybdate ABC transporter permease subunit [unclassified Psychrosphaera]MBU2883496.1 molybdate ABC transporter permease subunit [Psychrosphaera sp. I2R16]MBU2989675.1 molybdate ABC transporter permease subunit [Psychrosphaera sp. B3R10]MDC2888495.1 molybdate ABC transporter permease subunit [Psychrosphaera sp. G1-22]MDO6719884.1 molybdate ABC transporter permease subunit [Psychrosphaera sp. 1_MG-2023]